jgi:Ca-activated chloride channel family protein
VRRVLATTVVALALFAPAAAAQTPQARTPVVGGGSFNTAPLVGPGEYRDTLLPGERLFYGVKLGAGQRLHVSGQLRGRENVVDDAATGFSVGIQTPLREVDVLDLVDEDIAGNGTVTTGSPSDKIEFVSVPALTGSAARDEGITYRGPGTWYVSLYLISEEQHPPRVEIPVDLGIEVIGSPQPDPEPEKTPAKPAPAASGGGDGGGGTSIGTVLGVGVGALVLGGVLGAGAAAVTRRRRTA